MWLGPQKKNIEIIKVHYYFQLYRMYPTNIDGVWNYECWLLITNQNSPVQVIDISSNHNLIYCLPGLLKEFNILMQSLSKFRNGINSLYPTRISVSSRHQSWNWNCFASHHQLPHIVNLKKITPAKSREVWMQ